MNNPHRTVAPTWLFPAALPLVTSWGQAAALALLVALVLAAAAAARRARQDGRRVPLRVPDHATDLARLIDDDPDLIVFSVAVEPSDAPERPNLRVDLSEGGGLARVGLVAGQAVNSYVNEWPGEDVENYYRALREGRALWTQPYPSDPRNPASPPRQFAYHAVADTRGGLVVRVLDATDVHARAELAEKEAARLRTLVHKGESDLAQLRESARAERELHRAQLAAASSQASPSSVNAAPVNAPDPSAD